MGIRLLKTAKGTKQEVLDIVKANPYMIFIDPFHTMDRGVMYCDKRDKFLFYFYDTYLDDIFLMDNFHIVRDEYNTLIECDNADLVNLIHHKVNPLPTCELE